MEKFGRPRHHHRRDRRFRRAPPPISFSPEAGDGDLVTESTSLPMAGRQLSSRRLEGGVLHANTPPTRINWVASSITERHQDVSLVGIPVWSGVSFHSRRAQWPSGLQIRSRSCPRGRRHPVDGQPHHIIGVIAPRSD